MEGIFLEHPVLKKNTIVIIHPVLGGQSFHMEISVFDVQ